MAVEDMELKCKLATPSACLLKVGDQQRDGAWERPELAVEMHWVATARSASWLDVPFQQSWTAELLKPRLGRRPPFTWRREPIWPALPHAASCWSTGGMLANSSQQGC